MTRKKSAASTKPMTVVANNPDDLTGTLKRIGGSQSDHWNNILANQALEGLWVKNSDPETRRKQFSTPENMVSLWLRQGLSVERWQRSCVQRAGWRRRRTDSCGCATRAEMQADDAFAIHAERLLTRIDNPIRKRSFWR